MRVNFRQLVAAPGRNTAVGTCRVLAFQERLEDVVAIPLILIVMFHVLCPEFGQCPFLILWIPHRMATSELHVSFVVIAWLLLRLRSFRESQVRFHDHLRRPRDVNLREIFALVGNDRTMILPPSR
jgi:hypothetical protein